jgi:hypothetical protein
MTKDSITIQDHQGGLAATMAVVYRSSPSGRGRSAPPPFVISAFIM